ncbi:type I-E CRISPR-associated protein Cas5/CasD [Iodidimonas nitroreducens]|uniref:Type I-E CRISPR-associated protein Cas5/CasD n=1 Tax=Iodidimonas nitroreducens TaxID=1236968 RepID=A0A5A7NCZ5_9PROT|nr:type I-E CRISPR-associated protein Cas5/CasD [Iodidimonas nitroreducens]GAK34681.1 CRISPR system Cascade subunit CasD [alpha proteobacterium Q-1]GER05604.1 type I-E CRISPR-associated protein Cas5/CasD [Iodidimonas nitroreducens]
MAQILILRLESPLIAFGGEAVDNLGVITDCPSHSLITGLFANALGYRRGEAAKHQRLQDRLHYAVRLDRAGQRIRDFQTAELDGNDRGWTTSNRPEGRAGGAGSYSGPHLRYRDYRADASILVAVKLDPADEEPSLDTLAAALDAPARPLFIGRKPCLPATRLFEGCVEAASPRAALSAIPIEGDLGGQSVSLFWTGKAEPDERTEQRRSATRRNWRNDVHGGAEVIHHIMITPPTGHKTAFTEPE